MQRYEWLLANEQELTGIEDIFTALLRSRRIIDQTDLDLWLAPKLSEIDFSVSGLSEASERITNAIANKEKIVIYSDYDADGICGVALLWQALKALGASVMPYVPHRERDGYGLKIPAIEKLAGEGANLIITVDCGITGAEAVDHAKNLSIDVIITDHHVADHRLPEAWAIVHDTKVCGAAVAWKLAQVITEHTDPTKYLDLVAVATIGDMVPLIGQNRILAKHGLALLNTTASVGLQALVQISGLKLGALGTYEVGHMLVPRINALGRIEHALDALRLLCTRNTQKAAQLAQVLNAANLKRQALTLKGLEQALAYVSEGKAKGEIIVIASEVWTQGIIGLIAGRLVEEHGKPAIVMSKGEVITKGSCRSIEGFNIIETLRKTSGLLLDVGGHPMAAGFTIETKNIPAFAEKIKELARSLLDGRKLKRKLIVDALIPLRVIDQVLLDKIKLLEPFGVGNFEPVFMSRGMKVRSMRAIGNGSKHLKLTVEANDKLLEAIAFRRGDLMGKIKEWCLVDIVYHVTLDTWNGNRKVQLKIRDLKENQRSD